MSVRHRCMLRRASGLMAFVVLFLSVFEHSCLHVSYGASSSMAATSSNAVRDGRIAWENCGKEDVQITIMSREAGYEPGDEVCLDLYITNNTRERITEGRLRYRAKGIWEDTVCFEDPDREEYDGTDPDGEREERPDCMTSIAIDPGESRHVLFYYRIDDEIGDVKHQRINFTFIWDSDGKPEAAEQTFSYVVSGMNLLPVTVINSAGDDGGFGAGERGYLVLDYDLGGIPDILDEEQQQDDEETVSGSDGLWDGGSDGQSLDSEEIGGVHGSDESTEARVGAASGDGSDSESSAGSDEGSGAGDEEMMSAHSIMVSHNGSDMDFVAGSGDASDMNGGMDSAEASGADGDVDYVEASDADGDADYVEVSGADGDVDYVEVSGADGDADYMEASGADGDGGSGYVSGAGLSASSGTVSHIGLATGSDAVPATGSDAWNGHKDTLAETLSCRAELKTYGLYLDDFHVEDGEADSGYGLSAVCAFRVGGDAKPGIYYGTAVSSYKFGGRECVSTQGFAIEVIADDPAVAEVIRLIDDLPGREEIEEALGGFEASGDEAGYDAYYAWLYEQVMYVWQKYQALTEEQRELVYNRDKLLDLEWLWGTMPLAGQIDTWARLKEEIEKGGQKVIRLEVPVPAASPVDVSLPVRVPAGSNITLDLNGKTIAYMGNETQQANLKNLFEVEEGAVFTITCGSAAAIREEGTKTYLSRSRMRQGIRDNNYEDAIEKQTWFDHNQKLVTYYVIESMKSDMEFDRNSFNASAKKYRIDLSGVGAIEAVNIDNAVFVKKGGTLNIEGGRITAAKSNRGIFADGGSVNISGGYIVGNDSRPAGNVPANGGGVSVTSGGHLNMTGGVIANNKVEGLASNAVTYAMGNGGGVSVQAGGSAVIGGNAVIAGNMASHGNGGGIYGARGSRVIIEGEAQVVGNIAMADLKEGELTEADNKLAVGFRYSTSVESNHKGSGGGIYISPFGDGAAENTLTVKGGRIAGNIADACVKPNLPYSVGGGGIFTGGNLTVEGGRIENNYALEGGGGILIWYKNNGGGHVEPAGEYHCPTFYMSGGIVSGNTCDSSEGGGIRCEGIGTIEGGTIEGNVTNSGYDFGGGGIYVEMYSDHVGKGGKLTVKNALITENTAYGYGGGVAGCGKSSIDVLTIKGAAIYGNHVESYETDGKANPKVCAQGGAGDQIVTEQNYPVFFVKEDGQKRTDTALDYFCVGKSVVYNHMLGGGFHRWTGSCNHVEADPSKNNPLTTLSGHDIKKGVMGLTAQPSGTDIARAGDAGRVRITNNQAKFHGGGIACNGVLSLGKGSGDLRIEKRVEGSVSQKEFTFIINLIQDGESLEGEYPYSGAAEGWVQDGSRVKLKDGEWIEITGLPHDTVYTVTEEGGSGYDVIMTKNGGGPVWGRSISGTITITNSDSINVESVVVTNRGPDVPKEPPTGAPTEPEKPTGPGRRPDPPGETRPTGASDTESASESVPETSLETSPETESGEPTQPVPEEPDIPKLPQLPDPNDPDSPDRVIIVEEGVPRTYVKMWDQEQQMFVYIPEEDVPLFGLPKTGGKRDVLSRVMGLAILGIMAEWLFQAVKKRRGRSGSNPG